MTQWIIGGLVVLVLAAGGLYYMAMPQEAMMKDDAMMEKDNAADTMMKGDAMKKDDTMMQDEEKMVKDDGPMMESDAMMKGSYETYAPEKLAKANSGDVVLFFRAAWCPTCKTLNADIRSHMSAIPAGLTILDVNYDTHTALKQKYGVTYQHTFVQVDADGNQIKKWSGGLTLASLVENVQ
ncbi:MAG: thioredoxin family protein [Minisyncoccia bacterium]